MIITIVLTVALGWLLISVITAYFCSAVVGGGVAEDEARGYVEDGPVAAAQNRATEPHVPSPRRTPGGMAESTE